MLLFCVYACCNFPSGAGRRIYLSVHLYHLTSAAIESGAYLTDNQFTLYGNGKVLRTCCCVSKCCPNTQATQKTAISPRWSLPSAETM